MCKCINVENPKMEISIEGDYEFQVYTRISKSMTPINMFQFEVEMSNEWKQDLEAYGELDQAYEIIAEKLKQDFIKKLKS